MRLIATIHWAILLLVSACFVGCASVSVEQPGYEQFLEKSAQVLQAKRTYAMGHNVKPGTKVTWLDLATCLPAHWKPVCQSGGMLSPGPIGQQMKCTVHGQLPAGAR